MVGRRVSFWDGLFSMAMLISGRVSPAGNVTHRPPRWKDGRAYVGTPKALGKANNNVKELGEHSKGTYTHIENCIRIQSDEQRIHAQIEKNILKPRFDRQTYHHRFTAFHAGVQPLDTHLPVIPLHPYKVSVQIMTPMQASSC